jgi:hypothetical protein
MSSRVEPGCITELRLIEFSGQRRREMPLIRLWQLVTPPSGAWPDSTHLMRLISATPSKPKPTLGSDSPRRRLVFALQLTTPTPPFPTSQPQVPACHPCGAFVCNGTGYHRGVSKEIRSWSSAKMAPYSLRFRT